MSIRRLFMAQQATTRFIVVLLLAGAMNITANEPIATEAQRIVFSRDGEHLYAEATLFLTVSMNYSHTPGAPTQPEADVVDPATGDVTKKSHVPSILIGPCGIGAARNEQAHRFFFPQDTARPEVTLPFVSAYKREAQPQRLYFVVGSGELTLWWSVARPTGKSLLVIPLSDGWLSKAKQLPASKEHPMGGVRIEISTTNRLDFFIQFQAKESFGQDIDSMGTAP